MTLVLGLKEGPDMSSNGHVNVINLIQQWNGCMNRLAQVPSSVRTLNWDAFSAGC
jgi:hypothetical protein